MLTVLWCLLEGEEVLKVLRLKAEAWRGGESEDVGRSVGGWREDEVQPKN